MIRSRSAGGIVIGPSGTIAMVRHHGDGGNAWLFPKGRLEEDETAEEAARREIHEETGLDDLEYLDDLGTYERYQMKPDGTDNIEVMKEIHMFLFNAPQDPVLSPTLEIEAARWVSLRNVAAETGNAKDRAWFAGVFERVRRAVQRD
ncbi:MAG: NUDIX hydrolase [Patescibacteria group bacterium]